MNSNHKKRDLEQEYDFQNLKTIKRGINTMNLATIARNKFSNTTTDMIIQIDNHVREKVKTHQRELEGIVEVIQQQYKLEAHNLNQFAQRINAKTNAVTNIEREFIEKYIPIEQKIAIVLQITEQRNKKREIILNKLKEAENLKMSIAKTQQDYLKNSQKFFDLRTKRNQKNQHQSQQLYLRRFLNNQLQTLRGNIRVYCRIKPIEKHDEEIFYSVKNDVINFTIPKEYLKSENYKKDFSYSFQQVFDNVSQERIFQEFEPLIDSVLDGKNVCVFAYGQTGTGKTFTMQGYEKQHGIIPRSIQRLFDEIYVAKRHDWNYIIEVECVEIYNDQIKDLFGSKKQGTNSVKVTTVEQINQLLKTANDNRKVAGTNCNERSSRSHLIFMVKLYGKNGETQRQSCLCLVDLAGSERVSISKVEGDRLKQTQHINKSLSTLGLVIQSMVKKSQHVPFRSSKLTTFLEPFLVGESKTVMMMCISPYFSDWNQTQTSLSFSENVKKVSTGIKEKEQN